MSGFINEDTSIARVQNCSKVSPTSLLIGLSSFASIQNVLAVLCLELRQPLFLQPGKRFGKPFLKGYDRLVLEVALGRRGIKPPVNDEHLHLEREKRDSVVW